MSEQLSTQDLRDPISRSAPRSVKAACARAWLLTAALAGCGGPAGEGVIDVDAIRKKSIDEGKPDPIVVAPTTPEARKQRAEVLLKEATLKTAKRP